MNVTEAFCPRVRKLPRIQLPRDLRARALTFALHKEINNRFTMRGGIRPAELLTGKLCEIAACLWFALPITDEMFADKPDDGWDIEVAGFRIDVKGSNAEHHNLIWPASKVGDYRNRPFDLLMSVSIIGRSRDQACIDGVIPKATFEHRKSVATGDAAARPRLDRGTWYLSKDALQQLRADDLKRKYEASQ